MAIQILRCDEASFNQNKSKVLLDGQPLFNKDSGMLYIGDGVTALGELESVEIGLSLNNGVADGSVQQTEFVYTGDSVEFSDGTKGTQNGDVIPGAEALGEGSVAFGGLRYDYFTSSSTLADNKEIEPEASENWGRTPTSAEGIQSFAAGGSVHAIGEWSVALNKDTVAYHKASLAVGGGTQAGRSKEEFEEYFYDAENQVAINNGLGLNDNNEVLDADGKTYEKAYSFAFAAGSNGKALGYSSTKLGGDNESIGNFSLTSGDRCYAYANCQTILGTNNTGGKDAPDLIIAGLNNTSNCFVGAVFGSDHDINGSVNFAAGSGNIILDGTKNTILNSGNKITSGNNQYVGGYNNISSFSGAFVHGNCLTSSAYYQANFGKYNSPNPDALLVVGSGSDEASRQNALEVVKSGIKTSEIIPITGDTISIKGIMNTYGNVIYAGDVNIKFDGTNWSSTKAKINNSLSKSSISYDRETGVLTIDIR